MLIGAYCMHSGESTLEICTSECMYKSVHLSIHPISFFAYKIGGKKNQYTDRLIKHFQSIVVPATRI